MNLANSGSMKLYVVGCTGRFARGCTHLCSSSSGSHKTKLVRTDRGLSGYFIHSRNNTALEVQQSVYPYCSSRALNI